MAQKDDSIRRIEQEFLQTSINLPKQEELDRSSDIHRKLEGCFEFNLERTREKILMAEEALELLNSCISVLNAGLDSCPVQNDTKKRQILQKIPINTLPNPVVQTNLPAGGEYNENSYEQVYCICKQ